MIVETFEGNVSCRKDKTYQWQLSGKKARELAKIVLEKSHCLERRERLRQNFEGPTHYAKNREKMLTQQKQYYAENREERIAYNVRNAEKIKTQMKQRYTEKREQLLEKQHTYCELNKDKVKAQHKKHYELNKDEIKAQQHIRSKKRSDEQKEAHAYFKAHPEEAAKLESTI